MFKIKIRNFVKSVAKDMLFPLIYRYYCIRYKETDKRTVVFADAHHKEFPKDMVLLREALKKRGYYVVELVSDFSDVGFWESLKRTALFMRYFAQAGTVFLCDYYLPVVSVKKRKGTRVVQLWHACGAYKKFGYDAEEDLGWVKHKNMFRNFDVVSVSSDECRKFYAGAFHLPLEKIRAWGVSRTDRYFQPSYQKECRERFFLQHPEAVGRKIILWAPTFRSNAQEAGVQGLEDMKWLEEQLGEEWKLIIKVHPHSEKKKKISNCSMPTEELYAVADVLITDYSSVVFDFALLRKPMIFYMPDLWQYEKERGFYISGEELPGKRLQDGQELLQCLKQKDYTVSEKQYGDFVEKYLGKCDGHATERILRNVFRDGHK